MTSLRILAIASLALAAGCSSTDVCASVKGTCVDLTVQSSTITAIDAVDVTVAGAVTGTQHAASGKDVSLPLHVPVTFASVQAGDVTLSVAGLRAGQVIGVGVTPTLTLVAGAHSKITVDLEGGGGDGGVDLSGGDTDLGDDLPPPDMADVICDPRGITMPACVWRWQTPLPVGEDLVSVHAFGDSDIFALTATGTVLHRDGTGWSILPARPKAAVGTFHARKMVGGTGGINDLYISGYNIPPGGGSTTDEVFHSADKGGSWTEEALPGTATTGNNFLYGPTMNSSGDVLVAGGFAHVVTRAHGTGTWADYQVDATCAPPATGCSTNFTAVLAGTLANIVTYGVKGIYRANSGTNLWGSSITGPNANPINALCLGGNSPVRYWGVGASGVVTTSTDSSTWTSETSNTAADLYACAAIDPNNVWAFGRNGTIVASTNGGVAGAGTWAGQTTNTTATLVSGSHSPGTSMTVVGTSGVILRTMNGGSSYTNEQTGPSGGWLGIYGISPKVVYAVGSTGSIVHTADGLTWQPVAASGTTNNLIAVWGSSATDVYAVGANGTLVHSTDGTTFTKYNNPGSGGIPATATLVDIAGISANNVFVAADTGLYRSTDGGTSFAPVTIAGFTGTQVSALFAMAGGLWVGGTNGQIYYTTDGVSFASQTLTGVGASLTITRLRGHAPAELYAASSAGAWLAHTTNGGTSWSNGLVTSLGGAGAYDLAITASGNVYASGGALLVSQDGGQNFVPINTAPVPSTVVALYAPSDAEIFGTDDGGIVHFGN